MPALPYNSVRQPIEHTVVKRSRWASHSISDTRFGSWVVRPAFTVPAAVSLALGIAVNTTMFSIVNAALLKPLVPLHCGATSESAALNRATDGPVTPN
jgi:hypothetical protein